VDGLLFSAAQWERSRAWRNRLCNRLFVPLPRFGCLDQICSVGSQPDSSASSVRGGAKTGRWSQIGGCVVCSNRACSVPDCRCPRLFVDMLSCLEKRNEYAYLFNHDLGLFTGRALGCLLFLAIARWRSGIAVLGFALSVIALPQLISIQVAGRISRGLQVAGRTPLPGFGEPTAES